MRISLRNGNDEPLITRYLVVNVLSFVLLISLVDELVPAVAIIALEIASLWYHRSQEAVRSMFLWQLGFFFFIMWGLLTDPVHFLNFKDIPTNVYLFIILVVCACEAAISLLLMFNEKAIVGLLRGVSYASIAVVVILVLFIASEGAPAFFENDIGEFLTTAEWLPNYQPDEEYTQTFALAPTAYDFQMVPSERHFICLPYSESRMYVTVANTGLFNESVELVTTSSDIATILDNDSLALRPGEDVAVGITVFTNGSGNYSFLITGSDPWSNRREVTISVIVDDLATNIYPESTEKSYIGSSTAAISVPMIIENSAPVEQNYTLSARSPSNFVPSISGVEWNYSSSQGTLHLDPGERAEILFTAVMTTGLEGNFTHMVHLYDGSGRSIENATIIMHYRASGFTSNQQNERIAVAEGLTSYHWLLVLNHNSAFSLKIEELPEGIVLKAYIGGVEDYDLQSSALIDPSDNSTVWILLSIEWVNGDVLEEPDLVLGILVPGTEQHFGILGFVAGTFLTTLMALAIAIPLALGTSILLIEYLPKRIGQFLKPIFELLAGIPSVVYGLWGLFALGPFLQEAVYPLIIGSIGQYVPFFYNDQASTSNIMTASVVLSIMILPIILSLSYDAMMAVPRELKESSLALGSSKWQMIDHILLRNARSGIMSSIVLGLGRAVGETMAVLMIMGGAFGMPGSMFDATSTMTTIIATQFPSYSNIDTTRHVLFAIALILFVIILTLNVVIYEMGKRSKAIGDLRSRGRSKMASMVENIVPRHKGQATMQTEQITNVRSMFRSSRTMMLKETMVKVLLGLSGLLVLSLVIYIIADIFVRGGSSLTLDYFLFPEKNAGQEGGFLNAILGSFSLVAVALAFAVPLAVGSAIYIQEYCREDSRIRKWTYFANTTLSSTPSIIFGAFGFMFLIFFLDFEMSVLAAGLTLALMIMPMIFISASEAIKAVPADLREGSIALGASKWGTIRNIVLPISTGGITSGVIISVGRAIGETAAVLFTAGYATFISGSILEPTSSLPNMIYRYYDKALMFPEMAEKLYAVALTLIIIVLILNVVARVITNYSSRYHQGR